jgi:hypothetical protein
MKLIISAINLVALLTFTDFACVAEKYTYRSSGRGGSATIGGGYCGDWPFDNYVDVYAAQNAYKTKENGQAATPVNPYMTAYFYLWKDCSSESATLIEPDWEFWWDPVQPTLSFPGNNKLETGTAAGSFAAREIPCNLVTETYEDGEYVWYNCDYSLSVPVTVDVSASWTGTGSTFQDRSTQSNRFPGGFYKSSTKGTTREASVDFSVSVDGVSYDVGDVFGGSSYKYGYLFKSTSSDMSLYKF